jgi:uncharacterized protein YdeI (YjbR/CyaY-like superfamily)
MPTAKSLDFPILSFEHAEALTTWLASNHSTAKGIWLRVAKKGAGVASVTYAEAVEIVLCYGWIDGQKQADDEHFYLQRLTPRGAKSIWSQINRDKALALIEQGRMQPAGLREIERARVDGRWGAAYESSSTATIPPDLQAALDANPVAAAFYATLNRQNQFAILFRIGNCKKAETRARRIEQYVAMLARHEKLHP